MVPENTDPNKAKTADAINALVNEINNLLRALQSNARKPLQENVNARIANVIQYALRGEPRNTLPPFPEWFDVKENRAIVERWLASLFVSEENKGELKRMLDPKKRLGTEEEPAAQKPFYDEESFKKRIENAKTIEELAQIIEQYQGNITASTGQILSKESIAKYMRSIRQEDIKAIAADTFSNWQSTQLTRGYGIRDKFVKLVKEKKFEEDIKDAKSFDELIKIIKGYPQGLYSQDNQLLDVPKIISNMGIIFHTPELRKFVFEGVDKVFSNTEITSRYGFRGKFVELVKAAYQEDLRKAKISQFEADIKNVKSIGALTSLIEAYAGDILGSNGKPIPQSQKDQMVGSLKIIELPFLPEQIEKGTFRYWGQIGIPDTHGIRDKYIELIKQANKYSQYLISQVATLPAGHSWEVRADQTVSTPFREEAKAKEIAEIFQKKMGEKSVFTARSSQGGFRVIIENSAIEEAMKAPKQGVKPKPEAKAQPSAPFRKKTAGLLTIENAEWALAKSFFEKFPRATKLPRKVTYPLDEQSKFIIDKAYDLGLVSSYNEYYQYRFQQPSVEKQVILDHSFLKAGDLPNIYALKAGDCLGKGEYGKVKIAQNSSGDCFAVKIEEAEDTKSSVQAETEILEILGRLHGQKTRERGTLPSKLYTVQSLVPGSNLFAQIPSIKTLPFEKRVDIAIQICQAIQRLHEKRVIHGDIKPANIMINIEGNAIFVDAIDFGLSKKLAEGETHVLDRLCSVPYAAPELGIHYDKSLRKWWYDFSTSGKKSFASDIYSLGVLFAQDMNLAGNPVVLAMQNQEPDERPTSLTEVIKSLTSYQRHLNMPVSVSQDSVATVLQDIIKRFEERHQDNSKKKSVTFLAQRAGENKPITLEGQRFQAILMDIENIYNALRSKKNTKEEAVLAYVILHDISNFFDKNRLSQVELALVILCDKGMQALSKKFWNNGKPDDNELKQARAKAYKIIDPDGGKRPWMSITPDESSQPATHSKAK